MKIAIIGAGNLGAAIAKGLTGDKTLESLYLTKRNIDSIIGFNEFPNVKLTSDNRKAVSECSILILAVQPRHIISVLDEIKDLITPEHVLVSTATGVSILNIENVLGKETPIIRAMPNTAVSVGQSVTCICSNPAAANKVEIIKNIMNKLGTSIEIPEEQMQAATVICASGIAFWMRLIRATTQGAVQLGFETNKALQMSMHTCLGAATLLVQSNSHPEQEIDRVTTPGGCTIEGLNEMEHQGLSSSLIKGLMASFEKINQISLK